jgi:uncharacterized RDD family membrane protein YckC
VTRPGVGPRAAATIADAVVGFVVVGVPVLALFGRHRTTHANGQTTVSWSTSDAKVLLLWLVLAVAYYTVFELWLAATPGKLMLGLRVRMTDGSPLTVRGAIVRNALRVVDAFPYAIPYLVGAIAVWSGGEPPQRVGDRVAGTIVTYR